MKTEYRIVIGSTPGQRTLSGKPPGRLEMVKAVLLGLLGLGLVVGILLAAFVVGSIVASILLVLLAVGILFWACRRLFLKIRKNF